MYVCIYRCVYVYIYIYIEREREKLRFLYFNVEIKMICCCCFYDCHIEVRIRDGLKAEYTISYM